MKQIADVPWNGETVASTFSGAGGSSLGYRMAGFRVVYASEFVEAARETYTRNANSGTIIDSQDIRNLKGSDLLSAIGLGVGELSVLDGSPPCASFSTAGSRHKSWGKVKGYSDTQQRTDDLFFEFARILNEVQPKSFVAENVSGLVKGRAKGYFLAILNQLRKCGYKVEARLLNASYLGVPQNRERLFFIGIREDLGKHPIFPKPLPYQYSIRDAVPWIDDDSKNEFEVEEAAYMKQSAALTRAWREIKGLGRYSQLGYTNRFELRRPSPNKPCATITATGGNAGMASVTHPYIPRKFSIAETRRLCSFPDDFITTGTYVQQYERLGRAVPPVMMKHIATATAGVLCE
jgi:DNA (cytosine-5)-methyltransferase 1